MSRSLRLRHATALLAVSASAALAAGCGLGTSDSAAPGATGDPSLAHITPLPGTGSLGPGFATASALPPPGGTMTPAPSSWAGAHVPANYTAVLLATDDTATDRVLSGAVREWAAANEIDLTVIAATRPAAYLAAIQQAIDLTADLVISTGDALADPMALVTASWLEQKFLLLGAELAEPTANVTAAIWDGVDHRGGGATAPASDPSTFTAARAQRGLEAGVAAVVRGYSGFVVKVE